MKLGALICINIFLAFEYYMFSGLVLIISKDYMLISLIFYTTRKYTLLHRKYTK